jgi:hypothetical protein
VATQHGIHDVSQEGVDALSRGLQGIAVVERDEDMGSGHDSDDMGSGSDIEASLAESGRPPRSHGHNTRGKHKPPANAGGVRKTGAKKSS